MTTIKQAISNDDFSSIPIWMMRQAGRYMEDYMKIRNQYNSFLNLCENVTDIVRITKQPLTKFSLDTAIIFSDILVILKELGFEVQFIKGGPVVNNYDIEKTLSEGGMKLNNLNCFYVYEAIKQFTSELPNKDIIGFVGGAWTIIRYIESSKDKRKILYTDYISNLFQIVEDAIIKHAISQYQAGAKIIQIFDSWGGELSYDQYTKYILELNERVIQKIRSACPNIIIIGFSKICGCRIFDYMKLDIDVVGVDYTLDIENVSNSTNKIIQGNFDNSLLCYGSRDNIKKEALKLKNIMHGKKWIFNLGHGILPETPIDNVSFLLDIIRE